MDKILGVVSILTWIPIALLKILLVLIGLVMVNLTSPDAGLYRAGPGRPVTWWERAVRNPVGGFDYLIRHPKAFQSWSSISEPTKGGPIFQWRFRLSGLLSSLRLVWRYSGQNYGELYLGWKLGSAIPRLDFALSLRPWARIGN